MRVYVQVGLRRVLLWHEPEVEAMELWKDPKAPLFINDDERRCVIELFENSILAAQIVGDREAEDALWVRMGEFSV